MHHKMGENFDHKVYLWKKTIEENLKSRKLIQEIKVRNISETLIHLFWSYHVTSSFWKSVTNWLRNALPLIGKNNILNITALGLRPEPHSSEYSCQLNYCLLFARFHIWQVKMDKISPNFVNFLRLVKSRSIIEKKAGDTKKWNFLTDCLVIALDIDCFLSLTVKYQKIF